jgi:MFS superfamily sulfate permease-like transporter
MDFFKQLTNYYIKTNKVIAVILLIGCFVVGFISLFSSDMEFWVGLLILILGPLLVILVFGFLSMVIEMHRNLENIDKILTNIDEKSDSKKERKRQRPEKDAFVKRYGDKADELGPNTSRVRKESD